MTAMEAMEVEELVEWEEEPSMHSDGEFIMDINPGPVSGCSHVGVYTWWNDGWLSEVHLNFATKQITFVDGAKKYPSNGTFKYESDPTSGGRWVLQFHYKGDPDYMKKHILHEDKPNKRPVPIYTTLYKEAGGSSSKKHTAMWLAA